MRGDVLSENVSHKAGEPGSSHRGLAKSFPTANFKALVQKSLLAIMINYTLVDDFIESQCFCRRDDALAGIWTTQDLPRWN